MIFVFSDPPRPLPWKAWKTRPCRLRSRALYAGGSLQGVGLQRSTSAFSWAMALDDEMMIFPAILEDTSLNLQVISIWIYHPWLWMQIPFTVRIAWIYNSAWFYIHMKSSWNPHEMSNFMFDDRMVDVLWPGWWISGGWTMYEMEICWKKMGQLRRITTRQFIYWFILVR